MVESVDTRDLKSLSGDRVRVQAPPVAWKSPGKCRNAFTGAFLCIIAIQLFNATATALNCISQICCLDVALIS